MTKSKKQNSNQVPNGGYSISGYGAVPPAYSTTLPITGAGYANLSIGVGATYSTVGITGATGSNSVWTTAGADNWYAKQAKVSITDSDLVIDGLSLRDFMKTVNERLAVMVPNPELEKEFEELKECADRYRELEKKFLEQMKVWQTLKK
jgi:hypothetical protein